MTDDQNPFEPDEAQAKSFANISTELKRYNDRKVAGDEDLGKAMQFVADKAKEPGTFSEDRKFASKEESDAYAEKVKEMDTPPPEIKT
jgi:hypothetical protein